MIIFKLVLQTPDFRINEALRSTESRGSSVTTVTRVRLSAEEGIFSLHHRVQIGCEAHPASYQ